MEEFFDRLNSFTKKYSRFFFMLLFIAGVVALFKVIPYFTVLLLPFVIGWIISFAASPMVRFLKAKLHVPYKVGAIIVVLILLIVLTLLVLTAVSLVAGASDYIAENWEKIVNGAVEYLNSAYLGLVDLSDKLPFDFMEMLDINIEIEKAAELAGVGKELEKGGLELMTKLTEFLRPYAGNVATGTISAVKSLPEAIIFIIMLMLSTFFFTSGKEKYNEWYQKTASEKFKEKMHLIKTECFGAILGTLRAQIILMLITAAELFIGFMIMGVDNALMIAIIVAFVDMLPVLGVGTVLIPWSAINVLAGGSVYISVGLIILYLICLTVRNIVQPKILGESIGIGPLTSLVAIWVGYKYYGFIGMLIMPIVATILYKLYDIGLLDWFFISHKKVTEERERLAKELAKKQKEETSR